MLKVPIFVLLLFFIQNGCFLDGKRVFKRLKSGNETHPNGTTTEKPTTTSTVILT